MSDKIENVASMTRREFTAESVLALLAGVAITVTGCGGSTTATGPTPVTVDSTGTITPNHGHTATITAAQLTARNGVSLNIQGSSPHPHTVQLTADEVTRIAAGGQISKTSSTDNNHSHTVTFN